MTMPNENAAVTDAFGAPLDIEQIIEQARPTERSAPLCLRADLYAEFDELNEQLRAMRENANKDASLADSSDAVRIAQRLDELAAEMQANTQTFVFQALPRTRWVAMIKKHEQPDGSLDMQKFPVALIAACSKTPKVTEEQAGRLLDKIAQGQVDALYLAAWQANTKLVDIPKSLLASEILEQRQSSSN